MDMQKTGRLIRRLREARGITQKALAETLHVTDKAVSKWERGLSCPDVALLEPLAEQLGISVAELLQGERDDPVQSAGSEGKSVHGESKTQRRTEHSSKAGRFTLQKYALSACTLLFLTGGGVCAVCDLAVFGMFTWSLIPIAALIFAWLVLFPLLRYGRRGAAGCLALLSLAIFPFLLCLNFCLNRLSCASPLFLPISLRMAAISLAFLWGVYFLLRRLARRRILAFALCALLTVLLHLAVNFCLSRLIQTPFLDGWDLLTIAALLAFALFFWRRDRETCRENGKSIRRSRFLF